VALNAKKDEDLKACVSKSFELRDKAFRLFQTGYFVSEGWPTFGLLSPYMQDHLVSSVARDITPQAKEVLGKFIDNFEFNYDDFRKFVSVTNEAITDPNTKRPKGNALPDRHDIAYQKTETIWKKLADIELLKRAIYWALDPGLSDIDLVGISNAELNKLLHDKAKTTNADERFDTLVSSSSKEIEEKALHPDSSLKQLIESQQTLFESESLPKVYGDEISSYRSELASRPTEARLMNPFFLSVKKRAFYINNIFGDLVVPCSKVHSWPKLTNDLSLLVAEEILWRYHDFCKAREEGRTMRRGYSDNVFLCLRKSIEELFKRSSARSRGYHEVTEKLIKSISTSKEQRAIFPSRWELATAKEIYYNFGTGTVRIVR